MRLYGRRASGRAHVGQAVLTYGQALMSWLLLHTVRRHDGTNWLTGNVLRVVQYADGVSLSARKCARHSNSSLTLLRVDLRCHHLDGMRRLL